MFGSNVIVRELWRYPVKSMSGEPLREAELTLEGIPGDRTVYVLDGGDRIVSARTGPRLLAFPATLGEDSEPLVLGWRGGVLRTARLVLPRVAKKGWVWTRTRF